MSVITNPRATDMADLQARLHSRCLLCGGDQTHGLRLKFDVCADGQVEAVFNCEHVYQGYTGYLHGGVVAALLDSAMTNCLFANNRAAVTGELTVRYLNPLHVGQSAVVRAKMSKSFPPLFLMEAELRQGQEIMAKATAKFMETSRTDVRLTNQPVSHERGQD